MSAKKWILLGLIGLCSCAGIQGRTSEPKKPVLAVSQSLEARALSEASGTGYAIATQGPGSTSAAKSIFEQGGNAIDAAVAASFAISVERPFSTGLGGGGFLLYQEAKTHKVFAIDFRERAPLKATEKMYLDEKGEVIPRKSLDGIFAVATPGLTAGLVAVHKRFGRLPLATVMKPAITLARDGFTVYPSLAKRFDNKKETLAKFPSTAKVFLKPDGSVYKAGDVLKQPELALTLEAIAKKGRAGFYKGSVARDIVAQSKSMGGLLTQQDLDSYQVKWREPVRGSFRGLEIVSMPPPSSGGVHIIEMLNTLSHARLAESGVHSTQSVHATAAAMQMAFADRAKYLGDPDFVHVPVKELTSAEYGKRQWERILPDRARKSSEVAPGLGEYKPESLETTHISILDKDGNAVATTQTINGWFGSSVVAAGTGVLLNNEMDDFSAKPGAPNMFGALGDKANAIAPHKTPLSSMSPTIVRRDGKPVFVVGAPGGTFIITCVLNTILNYFEYGLPLYDSVAAVRFHHQWSPDEITIDGPGFGAGTQAELEALGYKLDVEPDAVGCRVMAIAREKDGKLHAVSEPREEISRAAAGP